MRLPALIHLLESVKGLSRCERILVLGSSALLASFPELGETGGPLELSYDADLLVEPSDEKLAAMLHEAVGEGSLFAQRTGYHADILRPEVADTLPPGWDRRLIPLSLGVASALSPEDLLVTKIIVGRPKDLELVRNLLRRGLVTSPALRQRLDTVRLSEAEVVRAYQRLLEVAE